MVCAHVIHVFSLFRRLLVPLPAVAPTAFNANGPLSTNFNILVSHLIALYRDAVQASRGKVLCAILHGCLSGGRRQPRVEL